MEGVTPDDVGWFWRFFSHRDMAVFSFLVRNTTALVIGLCPVVNFGQFCVFNSAPMSVLVNAMQDLASWFYNLRLILRCCTLFVIKKKGSTLPSAAIGVVHVAGGPVMAVLIMMIHP